MRDVLTNDQVAALVEAAREGQAPASEPARPRRARRVRDIDFSRPTKFPPDQERRLERAHEGFCRQAATQLSAELLSEVDLEVLSVDQLTWSTTKSQIPQPSICAVATCEPLDTQIMLAAEQTLMLQIVERLLGGPGTGKVRPRELTAIEMALVERVFGTVLEQLSLTWQELAGVRMSLREIEPLIANIAIAPPSEPTLVFTIEVKIDRTSATLTLVFPHRAIEPVLGHLSDGQYGAVAVDPEDAAAVRAGVGAVDVELRAEVASADMALDAVLALRPGDVLRFGAPAAEGVRVFAGQVPAHRALPGRNGNRRAVQIAGRLEGSR